MRTGSTEAPIGGPPKRATSHKSYRPHFANVAYEFGLGTWTSAARAVSGALGVASLLEKIRVFPNRALLVVGIQSMVRYDMKVKEHRPGLTPIPNGLPRGRRRGRRCSSLARSAPHRDREGLATTNEVQPSYGVRRSLDVDGLSPSAEKEGGGRAESPVQSCLRRSRIPEARKRSRQTHPMARAVRSVLVCNRFMTVTCHLC